MNKKFKFIYLGIAVVILISIWLLFVNYFKYEGCRDNGIVEMSISNSKKKMVFHKCEGSSFFYKDSSIYISNIDGSNPELLLSSKRKGIYTNPVFSPDQSKILLVYKGMLKNGGTAHEDAIYELDLSTKKINEIGSLGGATENITDIAYSSDGTKIYFKHSTNHAENGAWSEVPFVDLYSMSTNGSDIKRLTSFQRVGSGLSVSTDGSRLYTGKSYFDLNGSVLIDLIDQLKTSNESLNKEFWATTGNPISDIFENHLIWIGGYGEYKGDESIIYGIYSLDLKNNTAKEISSTLGYVSWPRFIDKKELVVIKNGGLWKLNLETKEFIKIPL